MPAPIVTVDPRHPQPRHIARAVGILRDDGLIAYPTDTYYAIGCDVFSRKAVERLYRLKGRDAKKPLTFLCPDLADVARYAQVSNFAYRTMRKLTPGPFTFVLEATRLVPEVMMTKRKEVGIRVPDSPLARALAVELGHPLVTSSATGAEGEALADARDIKDVLGHGLDLILDGGVQPNEPSTIVSLVGGQIQVLRQGRGIILEGPAPR